MRARVAAVAWTVCVVVSSLSGACAVNNCLACVRCGGSWAATKDNGTAYAQCLFPGPTVPINGTMYGGLFEADVCTVGAPRPGSTQLKCAALCGPEGPCPEGSTCGECLFAKSNTQCVTPAAPAYPYNAAVRAACDAVSRQGYPVATNAALLYGMSLPACDCPAGQSFSTQAVTCSGGAAAAIVRGSSA